MFSYLSSFIFQEPRFWYSSWLKHCLTFSARFLLIYLLMIDLLNIIEFCFSFNVAILCLPEHQNDLTSTKKQMVIMVIGVWHSLVTQILAMSEEESGSFSCIHQFWFLQSHINRSAGLIFFPFFEEFLHVFIQVQRFSRLIAFSFFSGLFLKLAWLLSHIW